MENDNAAAAPAAGSWLALCYLGTSFHLDGGFGGPYEVSGSASMTYDQFVEHVQERLDELSVKSTRRVLITRTFGKVLEMEQGRGVDPYAKTAALPFCSNMRVGTRKVGGRFYPILFAEDGETEIDRGPMRWSRSQARTAAVNEWTRRCDARNRSPNFSYNRGWAA